MNAVHPTSFDGDRLSYEMWRRGALGSDKSVMFALTRMLDAIIENDKRLDPLSSSDDGDFSQRLRTYVERKLIGFSTAIMANAGRTSLPVASCTVLSLTTNSDHRLDTEDFHKKSSVAFSNAIGVGYNISEELDPIEVFNLIRSELERINQPLIARRSRPVAAMLTIKSSHKAIKAFVDSVANADQGPLATASVFLTEELFNDAKNCGLDPSPIAQQATLSARALIQSISEAIHSSGNPGILFADRLARDNPTPQYVYDSVAPCAEIGLASGDCCHFGYINLPRMAEGGAFDWELFATAVRTVVRALDSAVDFTANASPSYALVAKLRRIGVCMTGLSDCFDLLGINYESEDAITFCKELSERLDFESKLESIELAKKRGPFSLFDTSLYNDQEWVKRKVSRAGRQTCDWETVFSGIRRWGIRHATTSSLSSAETASAFFGVSTSLEYQTYPAGHSSKFARSRCVTPNVQLQIQSALQSFLDDAISKTVLVPSSATPHDIEDLLWKAFELNLKGVSIFRLSSPSPEN